MNIDDAIQSLKETGLNIFLSIKVSKIPPEIFTFPETQLNQTLVIFGSGGKTMWPNLDLSKKDPIDSFSIEQMHWFEKNILKEKIEILFPNNSIQLPLQKLGSFLNFSTQSPLGIDISHDYGLWFAFRGVFLTEKEIPEYILEKKISNCEECISQACLSVEDFFNARLKCPVKNHQKYTTEQQLYHFSEAERMKNQR